MIPRRRFLATILLALPAFRIAAPRPVAAATAPTPGFHLVNGWILTTSDLEAIAVHAR